MHSSQGLALAQPGVRSSRCSTFVACVVFFPWLRLFAPRRRLLPAPWQQVFERQSQGRARVVQARQHNACRVCEGQAPYTEVAGESNPWAMVAESMVGASLDSCRRPSPAGMEVPAEVRDASPHQTARLRCFQFSEGMKRPAMQSWE
jgi:hypothetical protein